MTTLALMVDLSSNNPAPDLKAHYAAGHRVLCLKVSEGTSYAWARSHALSAAWHALGPDAIVWHYHFLHPGLSSSGTAQADYFWAHVRGDIRAGDRLVVDCETKGETGAEVSAFVRRLAARAPHVPRVIYGSPYFLRDHHIRPVNGEGLWIAEYQASRVDFIPPGWSSYLAWQYTDRASGVAGIPGHVDESHLSPAAMPHHVTPVVVHNPHPRPDYVHHPINCSTHGVVAHGEPVQWTQWALRIRDDGKVGRQTRTALGHCQHVHGITEDLIVGRLTGHVLEPVHR